MHSTLLTDLRPLDQPVPEFDLVSVLEVAADQIAELFNVSRALDSLDDTLKQMRDSLPRPAWAKVVRMVRLHRLCGLIHQDPFSEWSFRRPRGYPGDAHLLDFIYHQSAARVATQAASRVGRAVYARNVMAPACRAVRHRRDLLAAMIDEVAIDRPGARVLSVACGHLREATLSDAIATGSIDVLVALDQDEKSLQLVASESHGRHIEPRRVSVRQILTQKFDDDDFDFIYAAGLYDYLDARTAARLTRILFNKLSDGGRLLVANFKDTAKDAAYMEVFMDWSLLLRSERAFVDALGETVVEASHMNVFSDDSDTILYVELIR